nr:hypothetical protein [Tanacetum cinerariifolium]
TGRLLGAYNLGVATPRAVVHAGDKTIENARSCSLPRRCVEGMGRSSSGLSPKGSSDLFRYLNLPSKYSIKIFHKNSSFLLTDLVLIFDHYLPTLLYAPNAEDYMNSNVAVLSSNDTAAYEAKVKGDETRAAGSGNKAAAASTSSGDEAFAAGRVDP